jgi:hypothetical protein
MIFLERMTPFLDLGWVGCEDIEAKVVIVYLTIVLFTKLRHVGFLVFLKIFADRNRFVHVKRVVSAINHESKGNVRFFLEAIFYDASHDLLCFVLAVLTKHDGCIFIFVEDEVELELRTNLVEFVEVDKGCSSCHRDGEEGDQRECVEGFDHED